jgi:hypothetical protein
VPTIRPHTSSQADATPGLLFLEPGPEAPLLTD